MYRKEEVQMSLKQNTELPANQELVDHIDTLGHTQPVGGSMKALHQFYKQADTTLTIAARMDRGPVALLMLNHCRGTMPVIIHSSKSTDDLFHKITAYLKKVNDSGELNTIDHLIVYGMYEEGAVIPYNPISDMLHYINHQVPQQAQVVQRGTICIRIPFQWRTAWFCSLRAACCAGIEDNGNIVDMARFMENRSYFAEIIDQLLEDGLGSYFSDVMATENDSSDKDVDDSQQEEDDMSADITSDPDYDILNETTDLSALEWVEYAFIDPRTEKRDCYRINNPVCEFCSDFAPDPAALHVVDRDNVVHHIDRLGDDVEIIRSKARDNNRLGILPPLKKENHE